MIALVLLAGLLILGLCAILGWTADTRDDLQKLWPLQGAKPESLVITPQISRRPPARCHRRAAPIRATFDVADLPHVEGSVSILADERHGPIRTWSKEEPIKADRSSVRAGAATCMD